MRRFRALTKTGALVAEGVQFDNGRLAVRYQVPTRLGSDVIPGCQQAHDRSGFDRLGRDTVIKMED